MSTRSVIRDAVLSFHWHNYGLDVVGEADEEYAAGLAEHIADRLKVATGWRPIDAAGNVSEDPAPEAPDDQDEGETGPEETNA